MTLPIDRARFLELALGASALMTTACGGAESAAPPPRPVTVTATATPTTSYVRADGCTTWDSTGECYAWTPVAEGYAPVAEYAPAEEAYAPAAECVDWDAAGECVRWVSAYGE